MDRATYYDKLIKRITIGMVAVTLFASLIAMSFNADASSIKHYQKTQGINVILLVPTQFWDEKRSNSLICNAF